MVTALIGYAVVVAIFAIASDDYRDRYGRLRS